MISTKEVLKRSRSSKIRNRLRVALASLVLSTISYFLVILFLAHALGLTGVLNTRPLLMGLCALVLTSILMNFGPIFDALERNDDDNSSR